MKNITEFRFGDVSVDFSEDERVIVQDDDVKFDIGTEIFKQICIQYLCLECPDVIKFDGDNEEVPTETPEEKEALDAIEQVEWNGEGLPPVGVELDGVKVMGCNGVKEWHCKPYWKVVGHHIDGERFFVEHVLGGRLQVFPVDSNQYRAVESPQQELEAAYDLYCDAQHAVDVIAYDSFEQFKADEVQVKFWLSIVDKTNYRKGE